MSKLFWLVAFAMGLSSCASVQDIADGLSGNATQKITRTPIWTYKPDLRITIDGVMFSGAGVSALPKEGTRSVINILSAVNIDRVEISTCSRHDVCQIKGGVLACDQRTGSNPNGRFDVDTGWFGAAGKTMSYNFIPDRKERDDSCANLMIAIYDRNSLAAWGFAVYRNPDIGFPAHFTCNATGFRWAGVSVCSAKAGTIQEINFDSPIDFYRAETSCNIEKITDTQYDFQPAFGWCRASFSKDKKFHDVIMSGYSEVLIRDGKE